MVPLGILLASALGGCATESLSRPDQPYPAASPRIVRIESCEDRTGEGGERDLKSEASRVFADKLRASGLFQIQADASLVLTCDIERFAEGSAFKRWLMPGWGSTQAGVAVMVWERPGDKLLGTFRSQSRVDAGGLYTIGADKYIFSVAFDDVVKQMRAWIGKGQAADGK